MGSIKILKIVKMGKFKSKIIQKDGSTKIIVLNKVHFVPYMYCSLFSITSAMENGFSLTGRKDSFLMIQKKDLVIKIDHVIKSGGGKLVRVKMNPTNKIPSPCIHQNASRAHDILDHAREAKMCATNQKLGWTLMNKSTTCQHFATVKEKIKTVLKMANFPETLQGHVLALDISYVHHNIIGGN